jgi:RimJ/RimL family protein N-acetyltransferase
VLTKGKLEYLWDNMRRYPQVFDDIIPRTFEAFKESMLAPTNQFYEFVRGEEIIGMAAATQVRIRLDANMHLIMFDRRLRGREDLFRDAMVDFMKRAGLRRMTVILPEDNRTAIKLTERIGFTHEGTLRKAHLRDGIYRNYECFGILREELIGEDGHAIRSRPARDDGVPVRGVVRERVDGLPGEHLQEQDAIVHGPGPGNGTVPDGEGEPAGGASGGDI